MKKQLSLAVAVLFSAGVIFMSGCKKDDTTPPVITLTGSAVTQNLIDTYVEPGFTATDDKDGDVKSKVVVTGVVNGLVGMYTIKYDVSDAAGNAATEQTRSLTVKSDNLAGSYNVSDVITNAVPTSNNGTYAYAVTVAQSSTDYNKILINNFGGFGASVQVFATVSCSTITIPTQSPSGMSPASSLSGTGTYTVSGGIAKITNLTYACSDPSYGDGNATYTEQ